MERIKVNLGDRSYPISIGAGLFSDPALFSLATERSCVVITNSTVAPLYADVLITQLRQHTSEPRLLILPDGEQYKNAQTFEQVMSFLLGHNYNRDVLIFALGGGVIGCLLYTSDAADDCWSV